MIHMMQGALARWEDVQRGGEARSELRRLSHQLRGSGRTYGFHTVTRLAKAMESIVQKLEKNKLPADERSREAIRQLVDRLAITFR